MKLARTLLAVGLWLGFYALGLGVVGLLLSVTRAQVVYGDGLGFAGIACAAAAAWIAFGLIPRAERDRAPGRPLDPQRHPELFAWIAEIARAAGQEAPAEVYLLPEANAFAGRRNRWLGLRGTSFVGLGLPLFVLLDRDELGSVLAHELGHHHGGDTQLGPWIHGTRRAIGRALDHLDGSAFWLHLPFFAYGRMFLHFTVSASRDQELAADALAARVVGPGPAARALRRIEEKGPLWEAYFSSEVIPLLDRSFRPPVLEGFQRFLAVASLRKDLKESIERVRARPPSPFDTHPPLEARIAALGAFGLQRGTAGTPALPLLGDAAAAEDHAVRSILRNPELRFQEVAWDDIATAAWIPLWQHDLEPFEAQLRALEPVDLPQVLAEADSWGPRLRRGVSLLSREAERRRITAILGTWLVLELHRRRFAITLEPGAEVVAERDGATLEPDAIVRRLASGELRADAWRAQCVALGLDAPG